LIKDDATLDDDDDDTQSVDFLSGKNGIHPGDDESLNSSRSSLQQPPSAVFKGLLITRQLSNTSQPVQNPVYTGVSTNISNPNRRFSSDTAPFSNVNPSSSMHMNTNEPRVQIRNNVRRLEGKLSKQIDLDE
jgi:hypothetical protein